jgi:hypothetical protein
MSGGGSNYQQQPFQQGQESFGGYGATPNPYVRGSGSMFPSGMQNGMQSGQPYNPMSRGSSMFPMGMRTMFSNYGQSGDKRFTQDATRPPIDPKPPPPGYTPPPTPTPSPTPAPYYPTPTPTPIQPYNPGQPTATDPNGILNGNYDTRGGFGQAGGGLMDANMAMFMGGPYAPKQPPPGPGMGWNQATQAWEPMK